MGFTKRKKRPELFRNPAVKPTAEVQRRLDAEAEAAQLEAERLAEEEVAEDEKPKRKRK